jgi:hypothetical protein
MVDNRKQHKNTTPTVEWFTNTPRVISIQPSHQRTTTPAAVSATTGGAHSGIRGEATAARLRVKQPSGTPPPARGSTTGVDHDVHRTATTYHPALRGDTCATIWTSQSTDRSNTTKLGCLKELRSDADHLDDVEH